MLGLELSKTFKLSSRPLLFSSKIFQKTEGLELQSWTKHLRQTLVFTGNRALREKFNVYFSEAFC